MPNAIFIDTSNLNVLFKVNGKFVLGTNYSTCPDRIATDAQALGVSFDVYLSMWPRQRGESNYQINALSVGGVPFVVLREEVEAVLKLVDGVYGIGNVYLCNALANFVIQARVSNFQSVINYGSRVALLSVKDKMLESLKVYDTAEDLYNEQGENFSCYGDLDLIDVDAIKAQYGELTPFNKSILVPLSHLITSYHSPYNVEVEEVKKELGLSGYEPAEKPEDVPPPPSPPEPPKREPIKPIYDDSDVGEPVRFKKPGISLLNVLLVIVILAGFAVSGLGYAFDKTQTQVAQLKQDIVPFQTEIERYTRYSGIYTGGYGLSGKAAEVMSYAQVNTCGMAVTNLTVYTDRIEILCNTVDPNALEDFVAYLSQQYTIGSTNNLDMNEGVGGTTIYNYNIVIVLS